MIDMCSMCGGDGGVDGDGVSHESENGKSREKCMRGFTENDI